MAKAYLLVSVLTLIVSLVYGQEAFSEQELQVKTDRLVQVAEDFSEKEQNSNKHLLLLGSATSRADCIQKKKCKNKGGTCQKKGNACKGKSVKGCAKGCYCCLPENIICKRSKKCKRANGVCISRGKCNGKIIAKGCRKPKSCKKTHVCCVEDRSTTEVPTCRGPHCPVIGSCPNAAFEKKHVCASCENNASALVFVKKGKPPTKGKPRDVFTGLLSYKEISQGKQKLCLVTNPTEVLSWQCIPTADKRRFEKCVDIGYCTNIRSRLNDGHFEYQDKICYRVHFGALWPDATCKTLETIINDPDTAAPCMKECRKNAKAGGGCNAFNYKFGASGANCILKECSKPYPVPIPSTNGNDAYYL